MTHFVTYGFLLTFAGCATVMAPNDLIAARGVYDRASQGPAAQLDPADLHVAKDTLDLAEKSFTDNGDTRGTRDLAYTAGRRAEIAESHARTLQFDRQKAATIAQMNAGQTATLRTTSAALGQANQQIVTEQQRRLEAEKRAAQLTADLASIASVKQEPRGMVITLSGSVLFASAKSNLLPDAETKLNDVARALALQDPSTRILVEGYTDSQGGASYNQGLSQRRADSVREYLVSHGLASGRVTAEGFGLASPIADNASPEGRANNRRVEIVVQPATVASR
jgi:outer membrane protein OmpA-like peptidoglycan-associated protein